MIVQLPYPTGVTVNHQYVGNGRGRKLSDAAFSWREEARLIVRQSMEARPAPPLALRLAVHPPADKIKRDLDGILKSTIDAIFLELDLDDHMGNLVVVTLIACPPSPKPRIVATLVHETSWQE